MDIQLTIRETLEDNCEKRDQDWVMLGDPREITALIYNRIGKELGQTQEKLQKDVNNARSEKYQAEKREQALERTVIELTERLKSQEELAD